MCSEASGSLQYQYRVLTTLTQAGITASCNRRLGIQSRGPLAQGELEGSHCHRPLPLA